MSPILGLAAPKTIPADAVDLLRKLIGTPGTPESDLEDWLRTYPQVLGANANDIYPKTRFRFPGEPSSHWEPDVLYRNSSDDYFDIIELKRADLPLVRTSSVGRWIPSKPPRFSSVLTKAISQLEIYLFLANDNREYLERRHQLQLFLPRGLLIAGQLTDLTNARDLRFLRHHMIPSDMEFVTWTGILRNAERAVAQRVFVSVPTLPSDAAFDHACGINELVAHGFYDWTGFRTDFPSAEDVFERSQNQVEKAIEDAHKTFNIEHDEDRKIILARETRARSNRYYRVGKYCRNEKELDDLLRILPGARDHVGPRSFTTAETRIREGYADAVGFIAKGQSATSVAELKDFVEAIFKSRRAELREPDWYYRHLLTSGFVRRHAHSPDVAEILRAARWIGGSSKRGSSLLIGT